MKAIKLTSRISGIIAVICFLAMAGLVDHGITGKPYYITGGIFLAFGTVFVCTALVLAAESIMWHVRQNKVRTMIRHYIYAYVGLYILLMVLDHIMMGSISWGHNLLYSLLTAMLQLYFNGRKIVGSHGQEASEG